ncbi:3-oxoacyl-ACP synthase III family protein [Streptomyces sp. 6N223]|uniref:3-oxoacyl-ACP synthase III family protein n=1 Tax=Streptomyces sp. 6N223 TaxID=3457412 RepID=UPI003FD3B70B
MSSRDSDSPAGIISTGVSLPERRVSNAEIAEVLQIEERWVSMRTGIMERRWVEAGEKHLDLAAGAAAAAVESAGADAAEIAAVLVATSTPDRPIPPTAPQVQAMLGASDALAFDVNAACAGFLYAVDVARGLLAADRARRYVVVVGCDTYSHLLNPADRATYTLFGDGAGAVVMGRVPAGHGVLGGALYADGTASEIAVGGPHLPLTTEQVEQGGYHARMVGHEVAALMRQEFPAMVKVALDRHALSIGDIDHVVCHQANPRLVRECARDAGFPPEKVVITGDRYGNTAAASVPIGLDTAVRDGRIQPGHLVLLVSFGAGMTWAWSLVRWAPPTAED